MMLPIAPDTLLQQRYRILNLLGEGDLGRTYLATDRGRADEYCAIEEFIPSSQFPESATRAKADFKQEAIRLYQLQHDQIPRFWATFEEQNRFFLVRDHIEGKTYAQMLEDRRSAGTVFSEAEVWRLLLQVLPAIGYSHSKGIVHRDLSPANIVGRDRDSLPVLNNFGIVKEFANHLQAHPVNPDNASVGTPGYSPAEQIKTGQFAPHSDLYALAVTAIVLLTGKEPSALFTHEQMNWDWRKWTQISDGFANVLHKMLSPQPEDRYQTAIEVDRELKSLKIANSEPPTVAANPQLTRPAELPRIAVGQRPASVTNRVQTAITHLSSKSAWEKPQVFIPLAGLIALLTGLGSWLAVSHFRHQSAPDSVAGNPPKQIDFNNPTIPTDTSPKGTSSDAPIQPALDRPALKEGTVDANTPVRYTLAAIGGQNLDIQLLPATTPTNVETKTPLPNDPTQTQPTPNPTDTGAVSPIAPIPTPGSKSTKTTPSPAATPLAATQVLMTVLSPTGTPIDPQADRVVGWRGEIPTTGDYTIELRPIKGLSGNAFPYKLSVTQLAKTTPVPDPTPSAGASPPADFPVPIGGNGLNSAPAKPDRNLPENNNGLPTFSPAPVPIEVPKTRPQNTPEPEQPTRKRRRTQVSEEETPTPRRRRQVESNTDETPKPRRRRQVESNSEETPTPRRRRQVESNSEETPTPRRRRQVESNSEETPTPRRRRRNRSTTSETEPKSTPAKTPDLEGIESPNTPKPELIDVPEPRKPIDVPPPKNSTPPRTRTNSDASVPVGSETNDPD